MPVENKRGATHPSTYNLNDNKDNHIFKALSWQQQKEHVRKDLLEDFTSLLEKYEDSLPIWEFCSILVHLSAKELADCVTFEETVTRSLHQAIKEGIKEHYA